MSDFGSRLKGARKINKITQKKLAKDINVAQSTIANYENNIRFPGSDKLRDISDYLNVSIDYLLGLTDLVDVDTNQIIKEYNPYEAYESLRNLLLSNKNEEVRSIIKGLNNQGIDVIEVIEKVFIPVLQTIGNKWEKNEIAISDEHLISEFIEKLFAYISESQISQEKIGLNVVFMAPPGEEHILSLKMATEYFKIRGWNIRFIGRSIPVNSLIKIIERANIHLLVLSSTIPETLNTTSYIVEAIKSNLDKKSPKILLGGGNVNSVNQEFISSFTDYQVFSLEELTSKIEKIEKDILEIQD